MTNFSLQNFDPSNDQKNLFIEASAGTGKTYTIQLMVAKLISLNVPLKKILIVTYTEKAAGELKDRIRKKIDEVLTNRKIDKDNENEAELDNATLALFSKAYQDVDNAAIFTIHSFCQKALKEYAYDAGRPFDMSMINDNEVNDLVEQLIRDKWSNDEEFETLLKQEKNAFTLIQNLKKLFAKAVDMYKGKDFNNNEIIGLDNVFIEWNGESISKEDAEKIMETCNFESLKLLKNFYKNFQILEKHKDRSFTAERTSNPKNKLTGKTEKIIVTLEVSVKDFIQAIREWDIKNKENPFTSTKIGETPIELPDDDFGNALLYVHDRVKKLSKLQEAIQKELDLYPRKVFLVSHTPELFEAWQKYKTEMKCQSFNDMILSVHHAILDESKGESLLKTRLKAQYSYAIIDEFQDTNQLQWDIFSNVFDKIYVVGDPKQSIYSFQGADVNVYQKAIQQIENGMSLQTNFRSTSNIIEACNKLFEKDFFTPNEGATKLVDFQPSLPPANPKQVKAPPQINNKPTAPIWVSKEDINEVDFARTAVKKIVEWCTFVNGKTVLQIFDKKDCTKLKNVSFRDFAVLARSRSEMEDIEDAMRSAGVPFSRYKDSNLFNSRECAEWIAIFKAINAPDFSAWNRRLLSEALITDFFRIARQDIHYVESKSFDDPNNPVRKKINAWQELAKKRRYAEMLERIYSDTQIEERLMEISRLQNLAKLRQIGNYSVEYLYNHNCSIEDLVRHLESLANYTGSADDEDGNLIEKSTDYDAVQVMTIHASKGLEFPIVISVAGFKGKNPNATGPYLYHDKNEIRLGFGNNAREARESEELEEWKRLFYVDFTRASSILMLPRYEKWKNAKGVKEEFKFLDSSIRNLLESEQANILTTELPELENWDPKTLSEIVKSQILKPLNEQKGIGKTLTADEIKDKIALQKKNMASLQNKLANASVMQYSYSSLSGKADSEVDTIDGERNNPDEESTTSKTPTVKIRDIDTQALDCSIAFDKKLDYQTHLDETAKHFPRGSHVGNALHRIFERTKFQQFGKDLQTLDQALADSQTKNIIEEEFKRESLPIWSHKETWTDIATRYLWNTLHAKLPSVIGNTIETAENDAQGNRTQTFALVDIPLSDHKPEVQFNQNATDENSENGESGESTSNNGDTNNILKRFCKGFIDLLFVRTVNGKKRYSILDWKSDMLENNTYTPEAVKDKVDKDYSIQRVLYCYCLIQWLKQFYGEGTSENLSESEIFEQHFGGIYYAFIRGTEGGTPKGIYAQTWERYALLEAAYTKVKDLMKKSSNNKAEN